MRLNISLLIAALVGCMFIACQPGTGTGSNNGLLTPSGYSYEFHAQNDGPKPSIGDQVTYHETVFKNDSMLYSTHQYEVRKVVMPDTSKVAKPAPPSYEAIFLMSPGDSLTVVQSLDTFSNLPPGLLNTDKFRYRLNLVEIKTADEVAKEKEALVAQEGEVAEKTKAVIADYKAGKLNSQLKTTASGLKYIIHEEGTGAQAEAGNNVSVHYSGFLTDGTPFDNSFKRGEFFTFPLGGKRVIAGWDEGVALLKEGAKATFFIPSDLGYGERGSPPVIPANAELAFYIELHKAK